MSNYSSSTEETLKGSIFKTGIEICGHLHSIRLHLLSISFWWIIYTALIISGPFFYKILVDTLGESWNTTKLLTIISIWILSILLTIGTRYIFAMRLLTETNKDWYSFTRKTMKMLLALPIDYHISVEHGEKYKIIDRASEAVWDMWDKLILRIMPQVIITVSLVIWALYIDTHMTLISLVFLPIAAWWVWKLGRSANNNQKKANKFWDIYFGRISDAFSNLKIIRIFARESHEISVLDQKFAPAIEAQHEVRKLWVAFNWFGGVITALTQAVTLSGWVILYQNHSISLGTLFFFLAFTDRIYSPIFSIFENLQNMIIQITGYEKMKKLFDMSPEKDSGTKILSQINSSIDFKNLSFSYPSSPREVLSRIDFTIKKWEKIAFVGHTGSGKSTITQLLMRFYEPSSGTIEIDGTNIYDFTLESYRGKFAAVFQDTTLFNETIRHNLEYVRDGITEKELEKACKEANILEFIESLPEKWETQVGERGLKLSGGEKQRIAIARAILANPEILILDEATSALDTKTERLVQEAFEHLMHGRTSIIIAHRLSTIQSVDTIYFMEKWHIIASWNHRELYEKSKEYKELVDLQHDGFIGEDEEKEV
jgi:ABC-type multidrug transport system fused ATPase/permease subunit